MLNTICLVGRIAGDLEVVEREGEEKLTALTIAVPRSYKNTDGIYETDFIPCSTYGHISERVAEYCTKGDLVGIKGRIQIRDSKIELVAEKVTFLPSTRGED